MTGSRISRFISPPIGPSLATERSTSADLKVGELRIAEFGKYASARGAVQRGINADQIVGLGSRFEACLLARQRFRIGFGLADFLRDGVGIVGEIDARIVGSVRLRHFLGAVAQRHDAGRLAGDQRLRQREERVAIAVLMDRAAEVVVEFLRDVARQLEVLLLVLADRHVGGAIDQNVGRHQRSDRHRVRRKRSRGPCRPSP